MLRRTSMLSALAAAVAALAPGAHAAPTWLAPETLTNLSRTDVSLSRNGQAALALASSTGFAAPPWVALRPLGAGPFPAPLDTTSLGTDRQFPSVALSARGDLALALVDQDRAWLVLRRAGGTWGAPIDLGPTSATFTLHRPQVALSDSGDAVVAWREGAASNTVVHWILKPADGPLGALGSGVTSPDYSDPAVAMNAAGDAVVAWDEPEGKRAVVRVVSRAAGGDFEAPVTLSAASIYAATEPSAGLDAHGGAVVAWTGQDDGGVLRIMASRRTSAAADFGQPLMLSRGGEHASTPDVAVNAAGEVLVAWERTSIVQARLGALTGPFAPTTEFEAADGAVDATMGDSGAAMVTWGAGQAVRAALRAPGGAFGAPVDIAPSGGDFLRAIKAAPTAMDADGDAVVTWNRDGGWNTGYRLLDAAGPRLDALSVPATAIASDATPAAFSVAPRDAFSAVASTRWAFGDGATADGASVTHVYAKDGTYDVTVTATDAVGNATTATRAIVVSAAPASGDSGAPGGGSGTPGGETGPPGGGVKGPPPPTPKRCAVPALKGLTPARAKAKLKAAHCALGKVTTPKALRKAKGLVVTRQSRKAGSRTRSGAKVNVTLGRKPGGSAKSDAQRR